MKWSQLYPSHPVAELLDKIGEGSVSQKDGHLKILSEVEKSFRSKQIQFEPITVPDVGPGLKILPIEGSSVPLNRLAAGLKKYDPNFELRYCPAEVSDFSWSKTQAFVASSETRPVLEIGHRVAIQGSLNDPQLVHDLIHAKHIGDERRGAFHPYLMFVKAKDPSSRGLFNRSGKIPPLGSGFEGHYDDLFGFDEVVTFQYNLWNSVREYTKAIRAKSPDLAQKRTQVLDFLVSNIIASYRSSAVSEITRAGLYSMEKAGQLKWGSISKFKLEGKKYEASLQSFKTGKSTKEYAVFSIEEKLGQFIGLFKRQKEVESFQLWIPLQSGTIEKDQVPAQLLHQYFADIQSASANTNKMLNEFLPIYQILEHPSAISTNDRNLLMAHLEELTRRETLPGYKPQRTPSAFDR